MFGQLPLSLETVMLVVEISEVRIGMTVEVETVEVEIYLSPPQIVGFLGDILMMV